jgi:hypothetical protein
MSKQDSFIRNEWTDLTKEVEPIRSESKHGYQAENDEDKEIGGKNVKE